MKNKAKLQIFPYLSLDLHKALKLYAGTKRVSDSSVVEAALQEYFAQTGSGTILLQRLNRNARQIQRLRDEQAQTAELLSSFIRVWYAHTPALQESVKATALKSAAKRHSDLVEHVAKRINSGRGSDQVRDTIADDAELASAEAAAGEVPR